MKSQWYKYKTTAVVLRKKGYSLRMVEKKLRIPRSTLSYWFKDIILTPAQDKKLFKNWKKALVKARVEAVKWHNRQKQLRLEVAKTAALQTLGRLDTKQKDILEIALAMLYLGEGGKSSPETILANSNPLVLKFFLKALKFVYNLDITKVKCELHLRADQDGLKMKRYWSEELSVPLANFITVAFDPRTKGKKTYETYKGVCVLRCSNAAIQRRLLYLADEFSKKVILQ